MVIHTHIYDKTVVLVGVYIPTPPSVQVLHHIMQLVVQLDSDLIYFMGDFNMVPCAALDRLHSSARDPTNLQLWADTYALTNVWRHMHPSTREFPCHSATHKTLSRVDLVFASRTALRYVENLSMLPRGTSDHAPICLSLALTVPPESSLWRLSRFWVNNERRPLFVTTRQTTEDTTSPPVLWDSFKSWARGTTSLALHGSRGRLPCPWRRWRGG